MADLERARELFEVAVDMGPSERADLLERLRAEEGTLYDLLVGLLAEHDERRSMGTEPSGGVDPSIATGSRVGRYTILGLLGVGGMGAVYLAEQDRPRRRVALKLVRPGLATRTVMRRFELEAEVLGRLKHPGIAQVHDAGIVATDRGKQPYFAMEYVEGKPLGAWAAESQLTTRQRLELVAQIADAVHHAHQNGIIHRDLKPANILVTNEGQPKVLDFGVARATDADVQLTTADTGLGQLIGTVPYMSPEQALGDPRQLDTLSDVYALGVVAYELLAGRLPYELEGRLVLEMVRVIREEEPSRLSSIDRTLRGDVETIVGKALQKEKARRYQSAAELASDIRRYLADEPIAARPPSAIYQFRKFARRNQALVGGLVATFVVLVLGLVGTTYGLMLAEQSRRSAVLAQSSAEAAKRAEANARAEAEQRATELQQVATFQSEQLAAIDVREAALRLTGDVLDRYRAGLTRAEVAADQRDARVDEFRQRWLTVSPADIAISLIGHTVLDPSVRAIDKGFGDQPLVDAQLRQVLATSYYELGLYERAMPLQEMALQTRRRVLGESHEDTLESLNNMGYLLLLMDRLDEAELCLMQALEGRRRVSGNEHSETLTVLSNLGVVLSRLARTEEAERCYREALDTRRRTLGDDDPDTLVSVNNLGTWLFNRGRYDEAEAYWSEALEGRRRVLGEDAPKTIISLSNMGLVAEAQGRLEESERYHREACERSRRTFGEEHPETLSCMNLLGLALEAQGSLNEAESVWRDVLEKRRRVLGNEHQDTLTSIANMGVVLAALGRSEEAERYYQQALDLRRRTLGDEHPDTLQSLNNMGVFLIGAERYADAEPYLREVVRMEGAVRGPSHPYTLITIINLSRVLGQLGKNQELVALLEPAEPLARETFGENTRALAILLTNLGRGRGAGAEDRTAFELAEANLLEAHEHYAQAHGPRSEDALGCAEALVDLYAAWHDVEPDGGFSAKAEQWSNRIHEGKEVGE